MYKFIDYTNFIPFSTELVRYAKSHLYSYAAKHLKKIHSEAKELIEPWRSVLPTATQEHKKKTNK